MALVLSDTEEKNQDSILNKKKKWQIALRRYVINKNKSQFYAPYFGIDISGFRKWIETQFDESLKWDNFSSEWQFEHIVPFSLFDFENDSDLRLCWHFLNIKPEKVHSGSKQSRFDLQHARQYFELLYNETQIGQCRLFIDKIDSQKHDSLKPSPMQVQFLVDRSTEIAAMQSFTSYEFERLNDGDTVQNLLAEQALMKKFG